MDRKTYINGPGARTLANQSKIYWCHRNMEFYRIGSLYSYQGQEETPMIKDYNNMNGWGLSLWPFTSPAQATTVSDSAREKEVAKYAVKYSDVPGSPKRGGGVVPGVVPGSNISVAAYPGMPTEFPDVPAKLLLYGGLAFGAFVLFSLIRR